MMPSTSPGGKPALLVGMPALICSDVMRQVMGMAERIARSNAAVLITGESGVGKELVARALHHYSLRCSLAWVDINCGALPEHLVESELFGYEKGAFSGADQMKPGLFELAHTGTLFLDEVGELPPRMQVKLLRVLDGVPYYRLGGQKKVHVDARIVAATNLNLEQAISAGEFRSDLFHRLSQIQLRVPPLRERPEEIVPLAEFFLHEQNPSFRFTSEAVVALQRYPWPGNVRELRNAVKLAGVLSAGPEIRVSDLPQSVHDSPPSIPSASLTSLDNMQREMILKTLVQSGGLRHKAAAKLGISRRTLSRKLKEYGVGNARETLVEC